MTISSSQSIAIFEGNGIAVNFPVSFKVWDVSQLKVIVIDKSGISSVPHFTATLTDTGGTVTFLQDGAPLPTGWKLSVMRDMPFAQDVDLVSGTRFDPQVIEDQMDKATAERQQLREAVGRAIAIPAGYTENPQELLNRIFEAREMAVTSAGEAAQSAGGAAHSAVSSLASEQAAAQSAVESAAYARSAQEALEQGAPSATDTVKGVVYLSDAIDSGSGTAGVTAASPLAVRKVRDLALQSAVNMLWYPALDYKHPCIRLGSDGKLYLWKKASGPAVTGVGAKDPAAPTSSTYWLDYEDYLFNRTLDSRICQYTWFEDDMPRAGFFSCLGGVVQNFAKKYPKAAAYFNTSYGKKRLVTKAQYDALHVAIWHTNADGSKIGWNGIGGVNKFVWDKSADTLRLPDLAGMTPEQVGYDSLSVGGGRPDQIRNIYGTFGSSDGYPVGMSGTGVIASDTPAGRYGVTGSQWYAPNSRAIFSANNVVPTGPRNHGPRWVSDARVYLGIPIS